MATNPVFNGDCLGPFLKPMTDQLHSLSGDIATIQQQYQTSNTTIWDEAHKLTQGGNASSVNQALVDFADGAWYDIPASEDYLEVIPEDEAKGNYDPTANSAQKIPTRQA